MTLTRAGDNLLISLNGSVLTGNGAANTLTGAEGNDTYVGGAGNDALNDTSTSSNVIYRWGVGQDNDSQSSRNDCTGDGTVINAGTSAPLSVVATPSLREVLQMQRVLGPLDQARVMVAATNLSGDRQAHLLVQAMAQFASRSAQTDVMPPVSLSDCRRIELASPS